MKTGPKLELVDHAFMGSLVGWAAFILLDACRFGMGPGAASGSIAFTWIGMPILVFGSALLFTLYAWIRNRRGLHRRSARIRKLPPGRDGHLEP
jgi:hypothetical protein